MASTGNIRIPRGQTGTVVISLAPQTAVGGWSVDFRMHRYFGGVSGLIVKSMASGYYGVSGLNITNSGQGVLTMSYAAGDTSGMDYGAYAFIVARRDSGFVTPLSDGYAIVMPGPN